MIPFRGEGSALPSKKRTRKPAKRLNPDQSIRLVARGDGAFVPADRASRKLASDRGLLHAGVEVIGYLYVPRDGKQWGRIHMLGTLLVEHVEEFHGLNSHQAIKKAQLDGQVACDKERLELPGNVVFERTAPRSFAWGFMDEGEFVQTFRQLAVYIGQKYFGMVGPDVEMQMARLMPREPQA